MPGPYVINILLEIITSHTSEITVNPYNITSLSFTAQITFAFQYKIFPVWQNVATYLLEFFSCYVSVWCCYIHEKLISQKIFLQFYPPNYCYSNFSFTYLPQSILRTSFVNSVHNDDSAIFLFYCWMETSCLFKSIIDTRKLAELK